MAASQCQHQELVSSRIAVPGQSRAKNLLPGTGHALDFDPDGVLLIPPASGDGRSFFRRVRLLDDVPYVTQPYYLHLDHVP